MFEFAAGDDIERGDPSTYRRGGLPPGRTYDSRATFFPIGHMQMRTAAFTYYNKRDMYVGHVTILFFFRKLFDW